MALDAMIPMGRDEDSIGLQGFLAAETVAQPSADAGSIALLQMRDSLRTSD